MTQVEFESSIGHRRRSMSGTFRSERGFPCGDGISCRLLTPAPAPAISAWLVDSSLANQQGPFRETSQDHTHEDEMPLSGVDGLVEPSLALSEPQKAPIIPAEQGHPSLAFDEQEELVLMYEERKYPRDLRNWASVPGVELRDALETHRPHDVGSGWPQGPFNMAMGGAYYGYFGKVHTIGRTRSLFTPRVRAIREQLLYYFSPENLGKDSYLRSLFDPVDGGVPLAELLKFNRLRALTNSGHASRAYIEAIQCTPSLQLLDGGARVRLRSWLTWVPKTRLR